MLLSYLSARGFTDIEGNSSNIPQQINDLSSLISFNISIRILEIGFNAGNSSEVFLSRPNTFVTSFDLGVHDYVPIGKKYIDFMYPGRHQLILGDSTKTIPLYQSEPFDYIFIDGGHEYEVACADLINTKRFATTNTIIIMDDVMYQKEWEAEWSIGPTKAWIEMREKGLHELGRKEYAKGRGMAWGKWYSME